MNVCKTTFASTESAKTRPDRTAAFATKATSMTPSNASAKTLTSAILTRVKEANVKTPTADSSVPVANTNNSTALDEDASNSHPELATEFNPFETRIGYILTFVEELVFRFANFLKFFDSHNKNIYKLPINSYFTQIMILE